MKLFTKGLLLVAIPGLFELGLLAILYKSQSNAAQAEAWLLHTKDVIIEAARVREPILKQSARMRTGIIFDDATGLDKDDLWQQADRELDQLGMLVKDNPPQLKNVEKIRQAVQSYRTWTLQEISLINSNQRAILVQLLRQPEAAHYINGIQDLLEQFIDAEQNLDVQRQQQAEQARRFQDIALIAALLGSMLAAALAAHIYSRDLGGRLAVLTTNAYRLSKREQLAQQVGGNDEISQLDKVLHEASLRLHEAEQSERAYREELEWRARQLTGLNEDLRRHTQDNEMFIYSVSHDLRSPLVNLQGFSKELHHSIQDLNDVVGASQLSEHEKQKIRGIIEDDAEVSLNFIRTAVTRSALIIDAMLRLSRAGRVEYRTQKINVNEIVARVVDAMSSTIRERGAIVTTLPLPFCYGDATAVEQVFGNLIGNAVNYLDPKRAGVIEVGALAAAASEPEFRTYYVKDNGLGIPASYMGKMFSAFQRMHADVAQGEGIGLALIKRIVLRHGGRIWVESLEGVGTTFYLALPIGPIDFGVSQAAKGVESNACE